MPQEFFRLARLATMLAGFTVLAACGGGGGGLGDAGGNPNPPGGGTQVTVSGKITFDRLVFSSTPTAGLNPNAPVESPAREITVQALAGSLVLATATTDANGDYSFSVPASTTMFIRAQARMEKSGTAPTWSFTVRDNTDSDAMYVLDGASFNSGTAAVTRNLKAPSDWNGNGYSAGRRAAPFAILDTVYRTKQLILSAAPSAPFPPLNLYWSEDNKNADPFCPDNGSIGTSFYFRDATNQSRDNCNGNDPGNLLPEGIYILGDYTVGDTDEYDSHVIAHEFGHYFEDRFSRSDSVGGEHSTGDRLDLRVAFGEGWGNAFGAMALNDPQYRDSSGGISQDFGFNLETNSNVNAGWFSEASVGEFLWDVFDSVDDSGDTVSLGFTPIYTVMTGPQTTTNAMTSIFTFATAIRSQNTSGIAALLNRENINGTDDYGTNETADGGVFGTLPVYKTISLNTPLYVCSVATAGAEGNKLGNRQFLRFNNDASRPVVVRAQGATNNASQDAATDPDIYIHRRGAVLATGESSTANVETVNFTLATGDYIIEVLDFDATGARPKCMNVSITG
jgi:hypothetical protein